MSSSYSVLTKEETEKIKNNILEWTKVPELSLASDHSRSTSTRSPSLYAYHLPKDLQAQQLFLGDFPSARVDQSASGSSEDSVDDNPLPNLSNVEDWFFHHFLDKPDLIRLLCGDFSNVLRNQWDYTLSEVGQIPAINEEGVSDAEKRVAKVAFDLAALTLLDLSTNQIQNIGRWALFTTRPSREPETKADILLGLQQGSMITSYDVRNSLKHEPILPLVEELDQEYTKYLIGIECKNLLLGNPAVYLTLLLLTRLLQSGKIFEFWPKGDCSDCAEYAESHRVQTGASLVIIPRDSQQKSSYGLVPSGDEDLVAEIHRVVKLIPRNDIQGIDNTATAKRNSSRSKLYNEVRGLMKDLLQGEIFDSRDPAGIPHLDKVMKWVTPVRNIIIQGYSQMVRHDLTFSIISSHNTSFLMQRRREPFGQLTFSPLYQPTMKGYLILRAVWIMIAVYDAKERQKISPKKPLDPYKAVKRSSASAHMLPNDENDNNSDDNNALDPDYVPTSEAHASNTEDSEPDKRLGAPQSKKKKGKKLSHVQDTTFGKNLPRPPPGGGAGGAGGSSTGAGSSHSGTNIRGSSTNKRSVQDSSARSSAKRGRKHADIEVLADEIHLAFNCVQPPLQSSAFSHYSRVTNLSTGSTDFLIPFSKTQSTVTPPRRTLAASIPERSGEEPDVPFVPQGTPSQRRPSVASIASGTSTASSVADSAFWSSPGSTSSSIYTAPPLSSPSSPSSGSKVVTPSTSTGHRNVILSATQTASQDRSHSTSIVVDHAGTILDTKISQSAIGIIWGGNMILEGLNFSVEPIRVVVKLADWDCETEGSISQDGRAILEEAKIYEHLVKHAPNSHITPHYYGVFNGSGSVALILDDGGQRLPRNAFETLENTQKQRLFEMAEHLHKIGIEHCDLSPRNILMGNDGDLRIIDFHVSRLGHRCPGSLVCDELKDFAKDLRL